MTKEPSLVQLQQTPKLSEVLSQQNTEYEDCMPCRLMGMQVAASASQNDDVDVQEQARQLSPVSESTVTILAASSSMNDET
jgi:hypothetical protein